MASPTSAEAFARLDAVLRFAAARGISDVHVKAGQRPVYRRNGSLMSRKDEPTFSEGDLDGIAGSLLDAVREKTLATCGEVAFVHDLVGGGRFRITVVRQRGHDALAVRVLPTRVASLRELNLPAQLAHIALLPSGLVLVAGAPGSGRSSTWAALLEHINTSANGPRHVIAVEQLPEFSFEDKLAFVRQRELGVDVPDLAMALTGALRQDADVVAIDPLPPGHLAAALDVADHGRLVVAVVPGVGPVEALRVLGVQDQPVLRARLAAQLRAVVASTLVPSLDGKGRVPACQVLVNTPQVHELLRGHGDIEALRMLMEQGQRQGMQSHDQALADLIGAGQIALEAALAVAHAPEQLRHKAGPVRGPSSIDVL